MFKIPKWGDDVPKSSITFEKAAKHKKEKNKNSDTFPTPKNSNLSVRGNGEPAPTAKKKPKKAKINKSNKSKQIKVLQSVKKPKDTSIKKQTATKSEVKSRKRKHEDKFGDTHAKNDVSSNKSMKTKKRKLNINIEENPSEQLDNVKDMTNSNNFKEENTNMQPVISKKDKKKEMFKKILNIENKRNKINVSGSNLRQRMLEKLKAAQFRYLNEKLYTTSGSEAQKLFQSDPEAFHTYHQGYQQQLKKWPVNPLDLIVKRISKMPKTHTIADMGCGEAALSRRVPHAVRSFDLVSSRRGVEACDMAHTPLSAAAVHAAVYCLALMGTDLTQYLLEANRILKMGGHLLIVEVESRFDKVESFIDDVKRLGFKLNNLDKSHEVFFFMEFTKVSEPPVKKSKLPVITLKPCLYKKR